MKKEKLLEKIHIKKVHRIVDARTNGITVAMLDIRRLWGKWKKSVSLFGVTINANNEGFQPFLVYRIGYGDDFDEPVVHLALVSLNGPNMAPAQV
ncbi:hypothetical protein FACS189485_06950 [Spirochaetia bacterium]|nr:hypothetical protein FACS189485_06950 [Spirochaetia bacterium]